MFSHFRKGDFSLKDEPREDCPRELDSETLEAAVEANSVITVKDFSRHFKVSHMTVPHGMKRLGKVSRVESGFHMTYQLKISNELIIVHHTYQLFGTKSLLKMKSGCFITKLSKGISGLVMVESLLSSQEWASIQRRFYWVYDPSSNPGWGCLHFTSC